ncbi:MAG: pilus assembly protein TadG-related protein [Bryobacteraceae bacterium]
MKAKSKASQRGQTALFATISMVPVLGMIGLVVDAGYDQMVKEAAQTAAQSAAIAGIMAAKSASNFTCGSGVTCQAATACPSSLTTPTNPIQAACLYAAQNGFTNGAKSGNQTVMIAANTTAPPISGTSPSYWISATVSQKLPLTFLAVLGQQWANVSANSTAAVFGGGGGGDGCLYVMGLTGTDISMSGGGITSNCGVYVASNGAAAIDSSGGAITTSGTAKTNIVGQWTHSGGTITPAPILGASLPSDPFLSMTAPTAGSCIGGVSLSSGTQTISPGTYCGAISVSGGTLTLNPGLYYLEDGISVAGGAIQSSGGGVTFYNEGGSFDMSGGTITLNAPTSGTWQGILLFQSRTNSSGVSFSGGTQTYSGAVYAIDSGFSFSGGTYTNVTFVIKTISISGGTLTVNGAAQTSYTSASSIGFIQ